MSLPFRVTKFYVACLSLYNSAIYIHNRNRTHSRVTVSILLALWTQSKLNKNCTVIAGIVIGTVSTE